MLGEGKCVTPCGPRLVRIAQEPQIPGLIAETQDTRVPHVSRGEGGMRLGIVQAKPCSACVEASGKAPRYDNVCPNMLWALSTSVGSLRRWARGKQRSADSRAVCN